MKIKPRRINRWNDVASSNLVFKATNKELGIIGDPDRICISMDGNSVWLPSVDRRGESTMFAGNEVSLGLLTIDERMEIIDYIISICNDKKKELLVEKLAGL